MIGSRQTMAKEGQSGLEAITGALARAGSKGPPPVENCGITVDDAPFLAVELNIEHSAEGRALHFRTNVDDWVSCGPQHALRFEPEAGTGGLKPYLHVRRDLWAKVTRTLFFDLVEIGEERDVEGRAMFGVMSMGTFFPMAPADQVREFA